VVAFYNKRAAVENLIQEANNDIGLTAHLIAYNLNCWLALFEREESLTVPELTHRTVATNRLRLLYLAARITRHGGQTEIHFGAQYQERNRFDQLMARWRAIERSLPGFAHRILCTARWAGAKRGQKERYRRLNYLHNHRMPMADALLLQRFAVSLRLLCIIWVPMNTAVGRFIRICFLRWSTIRANSFPASFSAWTAA
jgi:hypothetical protein